MSDDDDNNNHPLNGISSLMRLGGISIPARAMFVGESVVSAAFYSITIGVVTGGFGVTLFPATVGPLVPYLLGGAFGYSFGLWKYWDSCQRTALLYARRYPNVLAHAMTTEDLQEHWEALPPRSVVRASQERLRLEREKDELEGPDEAKTSTGTGVTLDEWILQGGLGRMTWSVLAAQQCRADIRNIQNQERQRVVDQFLEQETA